MFTIVDKRKKEVWTLHLATLSSRHRERPRLRAGIAEGVTNCTGAARSVYFLLLFGWRPALSSHVEANLARANADAIGLSRVTYLLLIFCLFPIYFIVTYIERSFPVRTRESYKNLKVILYNVRNTNNIFTK